MPARWICRRNKNGEIEGSPIRCFLQNAIIAEPGIRRIEECMELLLREGEVCPENSEKRPILLNGRCVGYIEVSTELPTG